MRYYRFTWEKRLPRTARDIVYFYKAEIIAKDKKTATKIAKELYRLCGKYRKRFRCGKAKKLRGGVLSYRGGRRL